MNYYCHTIINEKDIRKNYSNFVGNSINATVVFFSYCFVGLLTLPPPPVRRGEGASSDITKYIEEDSELSANTSRDVSETRGRD